jgi:ribose/xylose/arabinose/galactoside ABC-type transport system permease subunit
MQSDGTIIVIPGTPETVTPVIVSGGIDLSVGSMLGLAAG